MTVGRPRHFDEHQALSAAALVFRECGFKATSMQILSNAMQMGEQSIYNAFGNKESLYLRALEHYCAETQAAFHALAHPDASFGAIEAFFEMIVASMDESAAPCLVTQTCVNGRQVGAEAIRIARAHMRRLETLFQRAIANANDRGELRCDDPKTASRYLNMALQGLGVLALSGTSKSARRKVVRVSLDALLYGDH